MLVASRRLDLLICSSFLLFPFFARRRSVHVENVIDGEQTLLMAPVGRREKQRYRTSDRLPFEAHY